MDKIIKIATERTVAQNLSAVGKEFFENFNPKHLPIVGTIDPESNSFVLVADTSVQQELMHIVNAMNQRSKDAV